MTTTSLTRPAPPTPAEAAAPRPPRPDAVAVRPAATPTDWREVTALLHDHAAWIRLAAGIDPSVEQPGFAEEVRDPEAHHCRPGARMFLATTAGVAVGIVAVRAHADGTAELKRMFVRPVARGTGVADRLVGRAVAHAADQGCSDLWLETLRGPMDAAIALYGRHGFREVRSDGITVSVDNVVVMARSLRP